MVPAGKETSCLGDGLAAGWSLPFASASALAAASVRFVAVPQRGGCWLGMKGGNRFAMPNCSRDSDAAMSSMWVSSALACSSCIHSCAH